MNKEKMLADIFCLWCEAFSLPIFYTYDFDPSNAMSSSSIVNRCSMLWWNVSTWVIDLVLYRKLNKWREVTLPRKMKCRGGML